MTKTLKGVTYVSVWVLLWGTAASLADFVLLELTETPETLQAYPFRFRLAV